jgi:hypothetical protein
LDIIAEFLSRNVRLLHSVEPSINEYVVETKYSSGQFNLFMSLGSGSAIEVTNVSRENLVILIFMFPF